MIMMIITAGFSCRRFKAIASVSSHLRGIFTHIIAIKWFVWNITLCTTVTQMRVAVVQRVMLNTCLLSTGLWIERYSTVLCTVFRCYFSHTDSHVVFRKLLSFTEQNGIVGSQDINKLPLYLKRKFFKLLRCTYIWWW